MGRSSAWHDSRVRNTWSARWRRPLALISSSSNCCTPMLMRFIPHCFMASSLSWLNVWGMPSRVTSMSDGMSKTPPTISISRAYW